MRKQYEELLYGGAALELDYAGNLTRAADAAIRAKHEKLRELERRIVLSTPGAEGVLVACTQHLAKPEKESFLTVAARDLKAAGTEGGDAVAVILADMRASRSPGIVSVLWVATQVEPTPNLIAEIESILSEIGHIHKQVFIPEPSWRHPFRFPPDLQEGDFVAWSRTTLNKVKETVRMARSTLKSGNRLGRGYASWPGHP